jgi:predicted amidohydrolase YtcJ
VNHPVEEHRVDVYDALKMFTVNGAYAIFEEDCKGTLEIGKIGDVVVLDRNIMDTPKEKLDRIKVKTTIKNGQIILNKL